MLSLHTSNILKIDPSHGLNQAEFQPFIKKIPSYLQNIRDQNLGFYSIIDDISSAKKILNYAAKIKNKFDHILVLGIGGSALGTICLQQSLNHLFKKTSPQLIVLDNIDPIFLREAESAINYKKTLFIVISKSGSTPETIAQYFYFRKQCEQKKLNIRDHFLFITDPHQGFLRKISHTEHIPTFPIPENIGGRFSVLTACGLVPAALIGLNIKDLLQGAQDMRQLFSSENFEKNLPFQIAIIQYLLYQKGKNITVLMPYAQKLIRFADWYRQLLAESIGKAQNRHGQTVNIGITPINALGVTDQHSQSQLYHEGPNDKLIILLKIKNPSPDLEIPAPHPEESSFNYFRNISFRKLLNAELQATQESLTKNNRPNITLEIEGIDEYHLGGLFMLFEASIAFLGELFEINAYNQPGVELSKKITTELLQKK